jgi:beta-glucosidase
MIEKILRMLSVLLILLLALLNPIESINVDQYVKNMTIEEKCGQMTQITFSVILKNDSDSVFINDTKLLEAVQKYQVGSILNTAFDTAQSGKTWHKIIRKVQEYALNNSRLRIPILYGIDSIHGANYVQEAVLFPQPLSLAATFNTDIVQEVGRITALETRAVGIPWNFNPVLDVGRQPLWPRYTLNLYLFM